MCHGHKPTVKRVVNMQEKAAGPGSRLFPEPTLILHRYIPAIYSTSTLQKPQIVLLSLHVKHAMHLLLVVWLSSSSSHMTFLLSAWLRTCCPRSQLQSNLLQGHAMSAS